MAVSKTAQAGIREICEASEVPWNDKKIVERIRAFRADARDAELDVSPEDLAGIIIFSFGTVLASVYGQSNVEVARKLYDVGLPTQTKRHLTGDNDVDWSLVSTAVLLLVDDIDARKETQDRKEGLRLGGFAPPSRCGGQALQLPDAAVARVLEFIADPAVLLAAQTTCTAFAAVWLRRRMNKWH